MITNQALYIALKELKVIDDQVLDQAYASSAELDLPFARLLLERDLISDENLGRILADVSGVPLIRLSEVSIPDDVLKIIPEVVAKKQRVIAFKKDEKGLHVAFADPGNLEMVELVKKRADAPVYVYVATETDVENALHLYQKNVTTVFEDIIQKSVAEAKGAAKADPPIIKIVETILVYAYQNKASDVHIEPLKEHAIIRFRIDGVLHDIVDLPLDLSPRIIIRIKVLAKLRTDEHQSAQDGKLQFKTEHEDLDVRVSIVPATNGEKAVLRLLSERSRQFSLADLGLSEITLTRVKQAYEKPYGMILSTGPTGAGKTTTMYAVLKILNKRAVNIMTIEDPVEYDIEGVNQIQVNPKTNLTFAAGLRSILRQDPDIILVGEIRDEETADIAINSALTGHLVLSTLHTNDAATAIPRLIDMGVEPFLIGSTVNIVIAQRLVRKIHSVCRVSREVETRDVSQKIGESLTKKIFGNVKTLRMYSGKGCKLDHNTGYEGRIAIMEVLAIDDEIRQAIIERRDAAAIRKIAVKNGMVTMIEDGLKKVLQGVTTIEEVMRVTKE